MNLNICTWIYRIALQLNFFYNYQRDIENFRCRDLACTYMYMILCVTLVITYGIHYFSGDVRIWNCRSVGENSTCLSNELNGGGACCRYIKEDFYHKIVHFMSISGGIISSVLLVIMSFLQITKIIQGKLPHSQSPSKT